MVGPHGNRGAFRVEHADAASRCLFLDHGRHIGQQWRQQYRFERQAHAARLDLGQVEDLVDQGQQVAAGRHDVVYEDMFLLDGRRQRFIGQ